MTAIQRLNRALLRTLMSPETADIVADRLEELEGVQAENERLRDALMRARDGRPSQKWQADIIDGALRDNAETINAPSAAEPK